ncbi:hypothetical protein [Thalassobaculum sp.]|uniref:hypothetical protein n=1 Tax=Thalassobaculum sp. TaxID=2022740 RepID=UPI0032EBB4C6
MAVAFDKASSITMFFRADTGVFDLPALLDLRACAGGLLARVSRQRTSLGQHMANPEARTLITATVKRFFKSSLPDLFAERFGKQPALNLIFTTIRLQEPDLPTSRVGWHIDFNFMGDTVPFLVAWTPLEDVGETRIGLDICVPTTPPSMASMLGPWQARSAKGDSLEFSDDDLDGIFGSGGYQVRSLRLPAGSSAVFDQFVFHRTQNLARATEARHSFEFRMVDLDALPASWRHRTAFFCRRCPNSEDNIQFLIKRDDGPPRPVDDSELDALNIKMHG